ncbi:site-specific integrase [Phaeovulum sp. NW3]|uniref:site-specific integrase n=1 Tax=Phaeovulum sp. NW3 TaxID=2934933 RepID=UPI0020222751|nr:site-specific integrase [Phaeovulum sp. NW3]MCL7466261.1 site-specific integrase [Phaeovulum sp. NW3]
MIKPNPEKNMADVVQLIEDEASFTPAFRKKVLGSVRRMPKLVQYGLPLKQIPADIEAFDRLWKRGPVRTLPVGFKSKQSFSTWRSQVRSALTASIEAPKQTASAAPEDDWTLLMSDLKKADVPDQKLIAVRVLADAARRESLSPSDVSQIWLQTAIDAADTSGRYLSLKAANKLIQRHSASISVPLSPDFGSSLQKSRSHCIRERLPSPLAEELEKWKRARVRGIPKGHRGKRKGGCSVERANQATMGVTYVYRAMLEANLLQSGVSYSVADLADPDWLAEVVERELSGENPWKPLQPTTLFEYLNCWKLFVRGCGHDAEPLTEVIRDFEAFENVKAMSLSRRKWCEAFLQDRNKQAAFFKLPNTLFHSAQEAMRTYDGGSQYQRNTAIKLGIAACAAAIWTSLPLRISTLLKLTFGGENADVQIHDRLRSLVVTTPPDIVKNGYSHRNVPLSRKRGGDPRQIVSWFVKEIRPRLLEAHMSPHLRRPDRLFGGVSYTRLSAIWRDVTLNAGVSMTPHQVRHAAATILANQPHADYAIIAALLGDTETTVRKNYVFVNQARLHDEGQNLLARSQSNILLSRS